MARLMKSKSEYYPYIPESVDDLIAWLNEKVRGTGVDRDKVSISLDYDDCYGSVSGILSINYSRPETDAEMQIREKREREAHERSERAERERYEFLKAKFEGSE